LFTLLEVQIVQYITNALVDMFCSESLDFANLQIQRFGDMGLITNINFSIEMSNVLNDLSLFFTFAGIWNIGRLGGELGQAALDAEWAKLMKQASKLMKGKGENKAWHYNIGGKKVLFHQSAFAHILRGHTKKWRGAATRFPNEMTEAQIQHLCYTAIIKGTGNSGDFEINGILFHLEMGSDKKGVVKVVTFYPMSPGKHGANAAKGVYDP
jgi:hypothetical protein